jgi:hypothetical protein
LFAIRFETRHDPPSSDLIASKDRRRAAAGSRRAGAGPPGRSMPARLYTGSPSTGVGNTRSSIGRRRPYRYAFESSPNQSLVACAGSDLGIRSSAASHGHPVRTTQFEMYATSGWRQSVL